MILLAIETSTKQLGAAILKDGDLLSSYESHGAGYPHATELPDAVKRVLDGSRVKLDQVEAIAVDIGPGSFTGLRIGLAFVKALSFGTKKMVVGIPSLDVLSAGLLFSSSPICPILDAKQKNVYAAIYVRDGDAVKKQTDYLLGPIGDVLSRISEPTIFLGDGALLNRELIQKRLGKKALFAPQEFWLPSAGTLARLGFERLSSGSHDDPERLVPLYLYPLDCSVRGPDRPTSVLPKAVAVP